MTISMYQASAPVLVQSLKGLLRVIDKAEAYAKARKIDEQVLLQMRIFPDMFAFVRQCQIVTDNAKGAVARLAGQTPPAYEDNEASFAELRARVTKTIAFLKTLDRKSFAGAENKEIILKFPSATLEYKGGDYVNKFVLPNVYFHITIAYGILRNLGVKLGKPDYLGGGEG